MGICESRNKNLKNQNNTEITITDKTNIIEGILDIDFSDMNKNVIHLIEIASVEKAQNKEIHVFLNNNDKEIELDCAQNLYGIPSPIIKKKGKQPFKIIFDNDISYFSFMNCQNLDSIDLSKVNTSNITNMQKMFLGCIKLQKIKGLKKINTTKVNNMSHMFDSCYELKDIDSFSNFNTSNVTSMKLMFNGCTKLKEINGIDKFDTRNVISMYGMFQNCYEIEYLDLSNFDTSNTTHMKRMFYKCIKLQKISGIENLLNVIKIVNMDGMLYGCNKLKNYDLSQLDPKITSDI